MNWALERYGTLHQFEVTLFCIRKNIFWVILTNVFYFGSQQVIAGIFKRVDKSADIENVAA